MSKTRNGAVYARAPDRLGDVVMAIPALRRLAERYPEADVDVWCPSVWAPVLETAALTVDVMAFRRTRAVWKTAARLRDLRYEASYLFTPSFSTAAVTWMAGIPMRRGTRAGIRGLLLNDRSVHRERAGEHRVSSYLRLVDPEWAGGAPPAPQLSVSERALEQFRQRRQDRQRADRQQMRDLQQWWLTRMLETSRPLEEKMTLFWHGHFATNYRAIEDSYHMFMQNQLFRHHAVGNFRALVHGIIRDPAMLRYLNNNQNRRRKPNEPVGCAAPTMPANSLPGSFGGRALSNGIPL